MSKALSTLAVGTKIEVPVKSAYQSRFGSKIVFKIADKNHSGYPSNSVTLITEKIVQIMASDAKEPNNSDSDRKSYGNNRHIHSNLLQWLNSNAAAGAWYSAQHTADQAPTTKDTHVSYNPYTSWAGFLAMLDPNFVASLLDTTLTVVKNTVTDGGSYESLTRKMFIASTTEVGLANENSIAEGTLLALFSNDASRVAYPTAECVSNSDGYADASFNTSAGWCWWLRTPNSSLALSVRNVYSDGTLNSYGAYYGGGGVRPLCNLSSSILVSDSVNASGNYEIIYNQPPVSGDNRWILDDCLKDISVNITDDYDHTIAETLQLIANAACCAIYEDRHGIIHIEPRKPSLSEDYDINLFNSYKNGNFELLQPLLYVNVNNGMYETAAGLSGEIQSIDNPFIQTNTVAQSVGNWVASWLNKRTSISGEYRSDPRLDCLDGVKSENKYALTPLLITSLSYSFNGAFKAKYVGRVYNEILTPLQIPMGTTYLGGQPTWEFPL